MRGSPTPSSDRCCRGVGRHHQRPGRRVQAHRPRRPRGGLSFVEFHDWALQHRLDLEDDDD
eukprot:7144754-Prymnesium_polylepis.2